MVSPPLPACTHQPLLSYLRGFWCFTWYNRDMEIYGLFCGDENCDKSIRYVGLTTKGAEYRLKAHLSEARTKQNKLPKSNWIRKHGEDNIKYVILDTAKTIEELKDKEVEWIKRMGTLVPGGMNLTEGGDGVFGYVFPEEVKERFRERTREQFERKHPRKILSDEDATEIRRRLWEGEYPDEVHKEFPEVTRAVILKLENPKYRPGIPFPSTPRVKRKKKATPYRFARGELRELVRSLYPAMTKADIARHLGVSSGIVSRYTK